MPTILRCLEMLAEVLFGMPFGGAVPHMLWLASLGPDGEVMELFVRHRLPQLLRHWEVRPMFRRLH